MSKLGNINFLLIIAIIVLSALAYGTVHQPTISLFYLAVAVMTLLWLADSWRNGVLISASLLQVPLFALALYGVIQMIPFGSLPETAGVTDIPRTISIEPFSTGATVFQLVILGVYFGLTLVYLDSADRLRKLITVLVVFGFIYSFFSILQSLLSPTKIYGIYESRFAVPFGTFVNRHNFAAYIELLVAIPLGLLFGGAVDRDKRLLYLTAIALMGIALLLSGSRGGLIAAFAEVAVLIFMTSGARGAKKMALRVLLAVLIAGAVFAGAFFVGGDTSLTRFAETANSRDISTNRFHIWSVTLQIIQNYFPFGTGLGAFPFAYTQFDTSNGVARVEQAHNDFLQIISDAGIVGLIVGVFFLLMFFRTALKSIRTTNVYRRALALGAFAGCFAVLVHSLFDFVLHTTSISILFLTLLAITVCAGRSYADDINEFEEKRHGRRRKGSVSSFASHRP